MATSEYGLGEWFDKFINLVDHETYVFGGNVLGCILVYLTFHYLNIGNKSWYLTLYSSGVTSFFGVYFALHAYQTGIMEFITADHELCRFIALFFMAYCVCDLIIGTMQYEELVTYDDGWFHHFLYIFVLKWLLSQNLSGLFAIALLEEVPTIIVSVYRVKQQTYPSLAFGITYFLTRICLHSFLMYYISENVLAFTVGMMLFAWHLKVFRRWLLRFLQIPHYHLSLNAKIGLFGALMCIQASALGYVVVNLIAEHYYTAAFASALLHSVVFLYSAKQIIGLLSDMYQQNFISYALKEKQVIYNISWEDPAVDMKALHIKKDDVVLTISSAGDNVLDYVVEGAGKVIAADINVAQLAVLELKLACYQVMDYEEFFALWGRSDFGVYTKFYKPHLRPLLSERARDFWDENGHLIENNFMFAGTSGLMAKILHLPGVLFGVVSRMKRRSGEPMNSVLFDAVGWLLSREIVWRTLAPLGGVPPSQLALINKDPQVFIDRLKEVLTVRAWKRDNYFYYGYVVGEFHEDCCPRYMQRQNYEYMRHNWHRVDVFQGTWSEAAAAAKEPITVASLLDSMDWMPHSMIADSIGVLVANMDHKKGRLFWRSFCPYLHSPVLAQLRPKLVPDYDHVGWYLTQFVADVPKNFDSNNLLLRGSKYTPVSSFAGDVKVMGAMAYYGLFHKNKDVKEFYKSQGEQYDGFRELLLPDRDTMMQFTVPWSHHIKTWASVGCGTARDLEYVVEHVQKNNTRVYLIDLAPTLLDMARRRVHKLGLQHQVFLVEGDITKTIPGIPTEFDLVTCSYCLTMIPNWEEALDAMKRMVKKGGYIAMIDFTTQIRRENSWDQRIYKWWFAHDGVWFNRGHVNWLKNNFNTVWYDEDSSRCPYTPYYPTHYVYCGKNDLHINPRACEGLVDI